MTKGYLFISNSSKPNFEKLTSVKPITIGTFGLAPINAASTLGYKLYYGINRSSPAEIICTNFDVQFYNQHSYRNIFAIKDNWIAFRNLNAFLKQHPDIQVIHCNTPIGGLVGRICGKIHKIPTIIYTAHGFHFYKGAPLFNRTILKWIEKLLAHYTDALITMNQEDFEAASKLSLKKGGKVYYIPGVGVDTTKFENVDIDIYAKKASIGLPEDSIVGIAMGDVIPRKNYKTAIEAIALTNNPRIHYVICGRGKQIDELKVLSQQLGIDGQIHFLGFRTDVIELTKMADFFLFASKQEGLPRSTMEAMASGKPCIVSKIRGHVDLIDNYHGGILFDPTNAKELAKAINHLVNNREYLISWGNYNKEKIKEFDIDVVKAKMLDIYKDILEK